MQENDHRVSRRFFLKAGAATLAGTALALMPGSAGVGEALNLGDEYVLDVGYAERMLGDVRIRTRTYNGGIPGPTLHTAPGRRLTITINNHLPPNLEMQDGVPDGGDGHGHGPSRVAAAHNENNPHDFNTTNLHVHGLQVSPHLFVPFGTSNPDAKLIAIEPGQTYTYKFEIPDDHPSGLHWYHPHHHGATALQVFNGMAGLIVVHGPIDEVPEIKAARDIHMAVQMIRVRPDKNDPSLWVNDPIPGLPASQGGFDRSGVKNFMTVNGEARAWINSDVNPVTNQLSVDSITARPGEVIRMRFLNGMDENLMPIQLEGHQLHVIGYDGVNVLEPQVMDSVMLAPGNRVEFLVKMGAPGTYRLMMPPVVGMQFGDSQGFQMANVTVAGEPLDMALPTSLPVPTREYPLIGPDVDNHNTLAFTVQNPYPELLTNLGFFINGKLYSEDRIDYTVPLGSTEEWTLTADQHDGHPFHLHVNSFQVVEINGVPQDPPLIKDVQWIPRNGSIKIRTRFRQWKGKSVYHCHILFHEDTGMMQNFIIT